MWGEGWVTHNICVFTLHIVDLGNNFVQVNTFIIFVTCFGGSYFDAFMIFSAPLWGVLGGGPPWNRPIVQRMLHMVGESKI
jgi:hypothetical protein